MGEHKQDKPDRFPERNRVIVPEKPKHPLDWNCTDCFHVTMDIRPGSKQMVCRAHPPVAQTLFGSRGEVMGIVSAQPPVSDGDWCSEFNARDITKTP